MEFNTRAVYLKHLRQWIKDHQESGASKEDTVILLKGELHTKIERLVTIIVNNVHRDVINGGRYKDTFEDLAELIGQDSIQHVLDTTILNVCRQKPKASGTEENRSESVAALVRATISMGADPHPVTQVLEINESMKHPNLLQQFLWMRYSGGYLKDGKMDPVANALIEAGADWQEAWIADSTNDEMRATLRKSPLARRDLLTEKASRYERPGVRGSHM